MTYSNNIDLQQQSKRLRGKVEYEWIRFLRQMYY